MDASKPLEWARNELLRLEEFNELTGRAGEPAGAPGGLCCLSLAVGRALKLAAEFARVGSARFH